MAVVLGAAVGLAIGLYFLRKYRERKWGYCRCSADLTGKVVIVTGATSGIGKQTVIGLAQKGATVVLACRNKEKALEHFLDVRKTTENGCLIFMELDLADISSIKMFAKYALERFVDIDLLINNAGVYYPPDQKATTKDGFEIHFGVNYLGHFLLTHLLLERLRETPHSRIINVSSSLYEKASLDLADLNGEKIRKQRGHHNVLYNNSKLANILHARELAKRLKGETPPGVFVVCPGFAHTNLFRNSLQKYNWLKKLAFMPVAFFFMRSAWQACQTTLHCCFTQELDLKSFGFYRNCSQGKLDPVALDDRMAEELWNKTVQLLNIEYSI